MKYFQMGIFVIPGVCLIRKYWSQTTAIFSVFQCFSGYRGPLSVSIFLVHPVFDLFQTREMWWLDLLFRWDLSIEDERSVLQSIWQKN